MNSSGGSIALHAVPVLSYWVYAELSRLLSTAHPERKFESVWRAHAGTHPHSHTNLSFITASLWGSSLDSCLDQIAIYYKKRWSFGDLCVSASVYSLNVCKALPGKALTLPALPAAPLLYKCFVLRKSVGTQRVVSVVDGTKIALQWEESWHAVTPSRLPWQPRNMTTSIIFLLNMSVTWVSSDLQN